MSVIVADTREQDVSASLALMNAPILVKPLSSGDFVIVQNDEKTVAVIVERKTLSDLSASLKDGRLRDQSARLANLRVPICIIVEGVFTGKDTNGIKNETLLTLMINKVFKSDFFLFRTVDSQETALLLFKMLHKASEDSNYWATIKIPRITTRISNDESALLADIVGTKKCKMVSKKAHGISTLALLPSVSPVVARAILDKYEDIPTLVKAFEVYPEETETAISEMYCNRPKRPKIGKSIAATIKKFLS